MRTGFIFDAYTYEDGIEFWVLDAEGRCFRLRDRWHPGLCFSGPAALLRRGEALLRSLNHPAASRPSTGIDLFTGAEKRVVEVRVPPPRHGRLVKRLRKLGLSLYNADIHPVQVWHYERGHFPLAFCAFEAAADGTLEGFELRDDPWALDYAMPPMRTAHLALTGSEIAGELDPNHSPRGSLAFTMDGECREFEGPLELQLESLAERLREWDPDVITTDWGDSYLLPLLRDLSAKAGSPLAFSRDEGRGMAGRGARSFRTYGRTVYQTKSSTLFGRWHLDMRNSFGLREYGLDGVVETARISRIPVQRAARCTIGTALTSMQVHRAWIDGVLVPMDKQQAEDFRPADSLVIADKGGLVYEPETGWHDEVVELDFVSMYPTLMERMNISPETVNCRCCPDNRVPEIGHHLCRNRRGIVPKVIAPILEKRARYKALARAGGARAPAYAARASAHKWTLVCVFGYLGFKNARFGKIEAHECVTAAGRDLLLRAKEAVERRGFSMLHANVDAVWLRGRPGTDYEALRAEVERECGCPLGLEGVYRWIRFCPSRMDPLSGVPGKYFGAFEDGTLKVRGIASRRRDTPRLLKDMQGELLAVLGATRGAGERRRAAPRLAGIVSEYRSRLREGRVSSEELAITFILSKSPKEYKNDSPHALAAKRLAAAGLTLHPGEKVRYVIASAKDRVRECRVVPLALQEDGLEYDERKYLELLNRAAEEILGARH